MNETTVHRALADERRAALVAELEAAADGLDVHELGRRVGLHPNTVRWHLGILADAGLVRSSAAPRETPGRPRILYRLELPAPSAGHEYRLLATVLAGTVARAAGGPAASEEAGRAWGHHLVRCPEPSGEVGEEEAIAQVVELLARRGFESRAEGRRIEMRRCPFHDLAENAPEVVCAVHRGLISGALAELGRSLALWRLEVFPRPDLCVAHLAPAGRAP
jgi:predicted ArsR family transcriptional regulator